MHSTPRSLLRLAWCGAAVTVFACGNNEGGGSSKAAGGATATGGATDGGASGSGGASTAGAAGTFSGGASPGGASSGGTSSGGTSSGGASSGGASSGGTSPGGASSGGSSPGGASSGGTSSGGTSSGGASSGGASSGGAGGDGGSPGAGGAAGSPAAGLIPNDRRYPWNPGIPGGIPSVTQICAVVTDAPYNASGDGVVDDAAAIQQALDDCGAAGGGVVLAPAGTYRVTVGLALPSGVVLRGDGPDQTRIEGDQTAEKAILQAGSWDEDPSPETAITGGLERGSNQLVVASTAEFVVGDFIVVDQLNDDDLVRASGQDVDPSESGCTWGSRDDGTRLLGQMAEITSIDAASGTVGIDPPLAMPLSAALAPEIQRVRRQITRDVGIEDLHVMDRSFRGDNNANIRFWGVAYSWIRNVESAFVSGRHVQLTKAFRCEVRDSYVHEAYNYDPGANAYGIALENQSTETLVENSIIYYLNGGLMMDSAGPGNVFGYNYVDLMFGRDYPDAPWLTGDMVANHCAHPFMNLWEGNMGSQIAADNIHGSSSHQTFFRNYVDREFTGFVQTGNLTDVVFAANNRYMNVVGNVLGRPGDADLPGAVYDQTAGNCLGTVAVYKVGYPSNCAIDTVSDTEVAATLLRTGNFDYFSNATIWDPAIPEQSLPPSLYLDRAPDSFGSTPWPPIGPDVNGYVQDIPAKVRFDGIQGG